MKISFQLFFSPQPLKLFPFIVQHLLPIFFPHNWYIFFFLWIAFSNPFVIWKALWSCVLVNHAGSIVNRNLILLYFWAYLSDSPYGSFRFSKCLMISPSRAMTEVVCCIIHSPICVPMTTQFSGNVVVDRK